MTIRIKTLSAALLAALSGNALAEITLYDKDGIKFGVIPKFDVGLQLKETDSTSAAGVTSTTKSRAIGDGGYATSRLQVRGSRNFDTDYTAFFDLDLRFGNVAEGKTGMSSNDKKVVGFRFPWGALQAGVQNHAPAQFIYEKPHPDVEIVKYGVAFVRDTTLTNRILLLQTKPLVGGLGLIAGYATGDQDKSNADLGSGNQVSVSLQGQWETGIGVIGAGLGGWRKDESKDATATAGSANDDLQAQEHYLYYKPTKDLKIGLMLNLFEGHLGAKNKPIEERGINLTAKYDLNERWRLLAGVSRLDDQGSSNGTTTTDTGLGKNNGKGYQLGVVYKWTKGVEVYGGYQSQDFDKNESALVKYDGTGTNFVGSLSKQDQKYLRFGAMMEW